MGVAVEGVSTAWPSPGRYELTFDNLGKSTRGFTLFNKGTQPYKFTATASPWIRLSQNEGSVEQEVHITGTIDWTQLPEGTSTGQIVIKGTGWQAAKINVKAVKPAQDLAKRARGFIEADGYIAIEAAHFKSLYLKTVSPGKKFPSMAAPSALLQPYRLPIRALPR